MPNLIEQQDLLKGLTDQSLAAMMQNPSGEIPPFLVAAEAQRRQAIRQQYSGDQPQESVVDTLTKQLTNVPENIQAPMQAPPQMPAPMMQQMPPQQGGVAALQQQMNNGGPVRRFATQGYVQPMWTIPNISGPIGAAGKSIYDWMTTPWGELSPGELEAQRESEYLEMDSSPGYTSPEQADKAATSGQPDMGSMTTGEVISDIEAQRRRLLMKNDTSKVGTSTENQEKPTEDDVRKRLQELYGDAGLTGAERAQKWFAAAQEFVKPDTSIGQSAINALSVWGSGMAEEAKAAREAKLAAAKGLLEYDIGERDAARASAAKLAEEQRAQAYKAAEEARAWERKQQELRTVNADTVIKDNLAMVEKLSKDLTENGATMTPEQVTLYKQKINELMGQNAILMRQSGYNPIASVSESEMNSVLGGR